MTRQSDSTTYTSLKSVIDLYTNEFPPKNSLVYLIRKGKSRERSLNKKNEILNLFQGKNPRTGKAIYPGDEKIKSEDSVTVQIHNLNFRDTDLKNIISITVWIPARLSQSLGHNPSNAKIKFIELFKSLKGVPKKSLQGLWAELFVIEQSKYPEKLIIGWHSIPKEKFDFSFDKLRVEVKSSDTEIRMHHFSSSQLNPVNNTEIIIASILVNINADGISLEEILGRINNKLNDYPKQKEKLHLLVYSILGTDIDKINEVKFDYLLAQESFKLYDSVEIPKVEYKDIPKEVSNIKFVSNIVNSRSINIKIDELIKPPITDK